MEIDNIMTLLEHGGMAVILYILLTRVMSRLDTVTDKLIAILAEQDKVRAELSIQTEMLKKP